MSKFKVKLVDYGIANRYPNKLIEINKKLFIRPEFKPLFEEIVKHELSHTDQGYSFSDFRLDMRGFKNRKLYWKFILSTPSSWLQFSPIYKSSEGKWFIDLSILYLWLFYTFVIIISTWIVIMNL